MATGPGCRQAWQHRRWAASAYELPYKWRIVRQQFFSVAHAPKPQDCKMPTIVDKPPWVDGLVIGGVTGGARNAQVDADADGRRGQLPAAAAAAAAVSCAAGRHERRAQVRGPVLLPLLPPRPFFPA